MANVLLCHEANNSGVVASSARCQEHGRLATPLGVNIANYSFPSLNVQLVQRVEHVKNVPVIRLSPSVYHTDSKLHCSMKCDNTHIARKNYIF